MIRNLSVLKGYDTFGAFLKTLDTGGIPYTVLEYPEVTRALRVESWECFTYSERGDFVSAHRLRAVVYHDPEGDDQITEEFASLIEPDPEDPAKVIMTLGLATHPKNQPVGWQGECQHIHPELTTVS